MAGTAWHRWGTPAALVRATWRLRLLRLGHIGSSGLRLWTNLRRGGHGPGTRYRCGSC